MNDQAAQTLFRFVSTRSPQLIDETTTREKFITEADFDGGGEIIPRSKEDIATMLTSLEPLSASELKDVQPDLHDFGAFLLKNRTAPDILDLIKNYEDQNEIGEISRLEDAQVVWDNLYYQYRFQQDHYAREAAIALLVGAHYVLKSAKFPSRPEENALRKSVQGILKTRILIPDGVTIRPTFSAPSNEPRLITPTLSETKDVKTAIASAQLQKLQGFKEELVTVEEEYISDNAASYNSAFETYQKANEEALENYQKELDKERREWFEKQKDKITDVQQADALFARVSETEKPVIPPFNYLPEPEVDKRKWRNKVSDGFFRYVFEENKESDARTFRQIETLLEADRKKASDRYADNMTFTSNYAMVNGVKFRRANTTTSRYGGVCYGLLVSCEVSDVDKGGDRIWQYFVRVTSNQKEVVLSSVSATVSTGGSAVAQSDAYELMQSEGTTLRTVRLFTDTTISIAATSENPEISVSVTLANGDELSFTQILEPGGSIGQIIPCEDTGEGDNDTQDPPIGPAPYIPSGFGMRQLGIADYRKVEQSVHCYIEGEVSHIENIMAREYKERSTRRLRRSENTTSTTSETEKEELSDTATTDRFELQNEIAKIFAESTDVNAYVNTGFNGNNLSINAGGGFANNTSEEESISQAVTEAQEITERAMERVVQKVKEERITKIIEEYEENNKHGFDNTEGAQNVVGVYRWIDKVYKNQIYNYGKRLMYEFFIPEPSRLHNLAMTEFVEGNTDAVSDMVPPQDPRLNGFSNARSITRSNYASIAAAYNAEVVSPGDEFYNVSGSYAISGGSAGILAENYHVGAGEFTLEIPENYEARSYTGRLGFTYVYRDFENTRADLTVGSNRHEITQTRHMNNPISGSLPSTRGELGIAFHGGDIGGLSVTINVRCQLSPDAFEAWQNQTFNAIIQAYEDRLAAYKANQPVVQEAFERQREANPLFYRQIEQTVLRKNCISYLIDRNPSGARSYGKDGLYQGAAFEDTEVTLNRRLDKYTSFATFLEQAIEWNLMSYNFYPFYWSARENWKDLYTFENNDALFRSFMQSGMARVIVTVRPGFEDAMMHYMATGHIWDGGELPVLNDPLYLSIVDELQKPLGVKQGPAWKTRVPTSLNILQADSLGLKVEKALPCNCDDESDFQESDQTGCSSGITNEPDIFKNLDGDGGSTGGTDEEEEEDPTVDKDVLKFYFTRMDGDMTLRTVGDFDQDFGFPREYVCNGQTIVINRNAVWSPVESVSVIYKQLALELSKIPGVTAGQRNGVGSFNRAPDTLFFTIDPRINAAFNFEKPSPNKGSLDTLSLSCTEDVVNLSYGDPDQDTSYVEDRLIDYGCVPITWQQAQNPLAVSRFQRPPGNKF